MITIALDPQDEKSDDVALEPVVVLIEDDADMRGALSSSLRAAGYQVIEASDGMQVIGQWPTVDTEDGPLIEADVVVTDQRMPGASGLDVLCDLRRKDWATQVILISAFADEELHHEARRMGACAVLSKPFDVEEFIDTVQRAMPSRVPRRHRN
jgi:DNA-binding NtrC family response regulator